MRRGFRYAARALVAAGALALTGQHVVQASPPAAVVMANDGVAENRLTVLKVRLAWMADPAIASFPLGIRPAGAAFEVCGFVPDDASRARALKVARACTGHPVHDDLILDPTLHSRVPTQDTDKLTKAAQMTLQSQMKIENLALTINAPGRVQIMGTVRSVEDKVTASHKLLLVPGCTSAVNNLTVKTIVRHGQEMTAVSADGNLAVYGEAGNFNGLVRMRPDQTDKVASTPAHSVKVDKPSKPLVAAAPTAPTAPSKAPVVTRGPVLPAVATAPSPAPTIALMSKSEPIFPTENAAPEPYGVAKSISGVEQTSAPTVVAPITTPVIPVPVVQTPVVPTPVVQTPVVPVPVPVVQTPVVPTPVAQTPVVPVPVVQTPVVATPTVPTEEHPVLGVAPVGVAKDGPTASMESGTRRMLPVSMSTESAALHPVPVVEAQPMAPLRDPSPLSRPAPVITPLTPDGKWPAAFANKPSGPSVATPAPSASPTSAGLPMVSTNSPPVAEAYPKSTPVMNSMVVPEPKARPTLAEPPVAPVEMKAGPTLVERPTTPSEPKLMPMPTEVEPPAPLPSTPQVASSSHDEPTANKAQLVATAEPMLTPTPTPTATHEAVFPLESTRIKHEIETQCGPAVSRVQLFHQADRTVLVRIFLTSAAAEKPTTEKLLHIPEVVQPGVKLELLVPE